MHDAIGTRVDTPMRWIGLTASAWILAPLVALLGAWSVLRRAWWALAAVIGTAVTVWLVNPALKRVFTRDRPDVRGFVEPTSRWGFPSGHAVGSAAVATLLVLLAWRGRARWPVTVGAVAYVGLVGISRLVLGVHYPSDLVAGWALGVAVVTGVAAWALARPDPLSDTATGRPDSTP